jgi:hypothetical protein
VEVEVRVAALGGGAKRWVVAWRGAAWHVAVEAPGDSSAARRIHLSLCWQNGGGGGGGGGAGRRDRLKCSVA